MLPVRLGGIGLCDPTAMCLEIIAPPLAALIFSQDTDKVVDHWDYFHIQERNQEKESSEAGQTSSHRVRPTRFRTRSSEVWAF